MPPARLAATIAVALGLLAGPSTAAADWQAVPVPAGGVQSVEAASADAILVTPSTSACCGPAFSVTGNRGASWSAVQLTGFNAAEALGAAPDGSFRVVASHVGGPSTQELQVFRIPVSGVAEPLGPPIFEGSGSFSDRFAIDDDGAVWVPFYSDADKAFELTIVSSNGSTVTKTLPSLEVERWSARRTAFGPRLVPSGGPGMTPGLPRRGTYRLDSSGSFVPAEPYPVEFAEGQFWFSPRSERASWDGGAHWSETFGFGNVVPRASGPARFLVTRDSIAERFSSFLYRDASPDLPSGAQLYSVVDAGNALVVRSEAAVYVQTLPLPPPPTAIGEIPADSRDLIARADLFRADAGLPPLIGDAGISRAAHNHSAYTAAHPGDLEGLSAHNETAGKSGFTGYDPSDRCAAVGASCGGEVMYSPVADPVGGWLATLYHRFLPGSPEAGLVGGGKVDGGWFVMDSGADRNVLVQPFGYPVGRWRGEEGFSGEIPDPIDACQRGGQKIAYPVGIAVTLYLPEQAGAVKTIEVRKHGESRVLPGCLLADSGSFILDDPLVGGATYDVHAVWSTGRDLLADGTSLDGTDLSYDWSFHFDPDSLKAKSKSSSCRSLALRTIKSVARARRGKPAGQKLGIEEKVTLKQAASVRLRRARLNYWKAGDRHSVRLKLGRLRGRSIKVGRTSYLRFRLPPRVVERVEPGEPAELQLAFVGRRRRGCNKLVHISRVRKIQIGWVRVKGPATWVSAQKKKRP